MDGALVAGAEVILRQGTDSVIGRRITDRRGSAIFVLPKTGRALEIEVRRLGFVSTRRLADSAAGRSIVIQLARMPATLDTIRTTDSHIHADMKPTIDSSEIAASSRAILYLEDVIHKLRPAMFYQAYKCHGGASSPPLRVYVNGEYVPAEVLRALRLDIHAEQIAEMHYVNCFDGRLDKSDHPQAGHLFVTLKHGYTFDLKRGTHPVESSGSSSAVFKASYRGRIIGLFDAMTGSPVVDATVTDLATGMSASTSVTGTVSLFFVDTTGSVVRLAKTGYVSQVLAVENSPGSPDLTLLMVPVSQSVATRSLPASDSTSKLDRVGFTFRRNIFAPTGAIFLTGQELTDFSSVSAIFGLVPGESCERGDIRIDGGSVRPDSSEATRWLDRLLRIDMILGIEVYRHDPPDLSGQFGNASKSSTASAAPKCTALIWTR